jgi:uncharacterized membrane protein
MVLAVKSNGGQMTETRLRTFVRGITYRILATAITAIITGFSTAILIHVLLTALYYIHERAWLSVKWQQIQGD